MKGARLAAIISGGMAVVVLMFAMLTSDDCIEYAGAM
jgi:hypothetical protein